MTRETREKCKAKTMEIIANSGKSDREIAEGINSHVSTVNYYRHGKKVPSGIAFQALEKFLEGK